MPTDELKLDVETILAAKRRRLALRQDHVPINAMIALANMQKGSLSILTEVNDENDPVKLIGQIRHQDIYDPVAAALRYIRYGMDGIALFTDDKTYSKGMDDLTFITRGINIPIIVQDYILNTYHVAEARAAGASALTLYSSLLSPAELREVVSITMRWRMTAIVQINDVTRLDAVAELSPHALAIGETAHFDPEHDLPALERLRPLVPHNTRVMPMGCMYRVEDVLAVMDIGVDAIIIDESLLKHKASREAILNLR